MSTGTITMNQMEMVVSQGITAEDIKAQLEAQAKSAVEKAMNAQRPEVAEPLNWWEVLALGPIQPGAGTNIFNPPLLPHQVIRRGEDAFLASIIVLNPFGPGTPTACDILQGFALPYQVEFQIGNTTTMAPAGILTDSGTFDPNGFCVYVNVVQLPDQPAGLYQVNVTGRILGNAGNPAPPFAGFARQVLDIDTELFVLTPDPQPPVWQFDLPIRYQVYE